MAVVEDAAHAFPAAYRGEPDRSPATAVPRGRRSPSTRRRTSPPPRADAHRRPGVPRRGPDLEPARHEPRRLEPLRTGRVVVLRGHPARVQVQHDRHPAALGLHQLTKLPASRAGAEIVAHWERSPAMRRSSCRSPVRRRPRVAPVPDPVATSTCSRSAAARVIELADRPQDRHQRPLHPRAPAPLLPRPLRLRARRLPRGRREYQRLVSLPMYPQLTDADVDDVVEAVTEVVRGARRSPSGGRQRVGWAPMGHR